MILPPPLPHARIRAAKLQSFACEKNEEKCEFLKQNHKFQALILDSANLGNVKVMDPLSGTEIYTPYCDIFMCGFSCTSRSPLNVNRSKTKGCVAAAEGATGVSFDTSFNYVTTAWPKIVIVDDVMQLYEKGEDEEESDVDFILKKFRKAGYIARAWPFQATSYGSIATASARSRSQRVHDFSAITASE